MNRQDKYLALLFELKNQCEKPGFNLKEFQKNSRVDISFIDAVYKIGMVSKRSYKWLSGDPTLEDAKMCIELVNEFALKRMKIIFNK